jgi:hypothetical protein
MSFTADLAEPTFKHGTSKIVLFGDAQVGAFVPTCNQVLVITTARELVRCSDAFAIVDQNRCNHSLVKRCFVRDPSIHASRIISEKERRPLLGMFARNNICLNILKQPDLRIAVVPKYDPVNPDDAVDAIIDDIRRPLSSIGPEHICARLGQAFLDVLRGCWVLADASICHGDLKINNLFMDGRDQSFKIGDFGLATAMDAIDFTGRFGPLLSPWYHPIFYAIYHASIDPSEKQSLQAQHAGLIDRFAFLSLIYQFYLSVGWSQLLSLTCARRIQTQLLELLGRCCEPQTVDPARQVFDQHSACWAQWAKASFDSAGMAHSAAYCQLLCDNNLFTIKKWPQLYDTIWTWTHPGKRLPPFESFIAT